MPRQLRRLITLLTIPLLLLMSGCMRMTADYEILSDDEVEVAMDVGMRNDMIAEMGEQVPNFCEQAGPMDIEGISAEEYADEDAEGYSGCRLTGTAPLGELNEGGTTLTLEDGTWTFFMEGDDAGDAEGMSADMFSDFLIRVTFPGKVLTHNGASTVEGNTVTWADPADLFTKEGLKATAENGGGAMPWLWIAIAALVVIGAAVALIIVLGRKRKTSPPQQGGPWQEGEGQQFPHQDGQGQQYSPQGPGPQGPGPQGPAPQGPGPQGPAPQGPAPQGPAPQGPGAGQQYPPQGNPGQQYPPQGNPGQQNPPQAPEPR